MLFPEYAYNFELGLTKYLNQPRNYFSFRGFSTLLSRHIGRDTFTIFADQSTPSMNTILYNGEELTTYANNNLGNRYIFGASFDGNFSFTDQLSLRGDLNIIEAAKSKKYGPLPSISPVFGNLVSHLSKRSVGLLVCVTSLAAAKPQKTTVREEKTA